MPTPSPERELRYIRSCLVDNAISYARVNWLRLIGKGNLFYFKPLRCVVRLGRFGDIDVVQAFDVNQRQGFNSLVGHHVWATIVAGQAGADQEVRGEFHDFRELRALERLAIEAP